MYKFADENATAIENYGVTPAKLAALLASMELFRDIMQTPGDMRAVTNAAGLSVDKKIAAIDYQLRIIDGMIDSQAMNQEMLYIQYYNDRGIDDNTSGPSLVPDVSTTIDPQSISSVLTIPYFADRSFRVKNLGDTELIWGLSTNATSITNEPNTIAAKGISEKLSSTLGASGDLLVFQNAHTFAVPVLVFIFD